MAIRPLMKIKKAIDGLSFESDAMTASFDYDRAVRMLVLAEHIVQELKAEVFKGINELPCLTIKKGLDVDDGCDVFTFQEAPEAGEPVNAPGDLI